MSQDLTSLLPDGHSFEFWEKAPAWSRELHVNPGDPNASDGNDGSAAAPLRTISRAAELAEPGTRVRSHAGLYRECVSPARGGTDPEHMISYEAYGDGKVILRASEEVSDFIPSEGWSLRSGPGEAEENGSRV